MLSCASQIFVGRMNYVDDLFSLFQFPREDEVYCHVRTSLTHFLPFIAIMSSNRLTLRYPGWVDMEISEGLGDQSPTDELGCSWPFPDTEYAFSGNANFNASS